MRKKQLIFCLSIILLASVLYLIGLPEHAVETSTLLQTNLDYDMASKFQALQEPSSEPRQTDHVIMKKVPPQFMVHDDPVASADQETFYSIADATISEGYPSLTGGDTIDMWAGYDPIYDAREVRSLLEFNIDNLPPDLNITEAILRVSLIVSADIEGKSRLIRTYRIGEQWSEGSVTWDNQPSHNEGYGSTSIVHAAWGWYEFDVTDLVKGWYAGTYTNHGLMLRGPDSSSSNPGWRGFSTREGPDTPQLVVTYVSVTEPPNAPTGLSAMAVSKTQINLTWQDNSADETAFHIDRSPDGIDWVEIATVAANETSYNDTGLDCDTTYHYRVRAYRSSDNQFSVYSDPPATATTLPCGQTVCLPLILVSGPPPVSGHYIGSSPPVSFDVIGEQVCNFDITVPFLSGSCHFRTKSDVCFEIDSGSFRIEEYHEVFGLIVMIEGTFNSSWTTASGNYGVSYCQNTLITPPSTGTWEASKQ